MTKKCENKTAWRFGFPRGIAAVPESFAVRGGFGIALPSASSVGYFDRGFALPGKPGEGCRFTGEASSDYGAMYNDVMMIVSWTGADGKAVQRDYVAFHDGKDGARSFDQVFAIPEGAAQLELRVIAKWRAGRTTFRRIAVSPAPAPARRLVRVVTIPLHMAWHPGRVNTPRENHEHFEEVLRSTLERIERPDLVVLPEANTNINTGRAYPERAEPIPGGPTWKIVSRNAKRFHVNIVAGAIQRDEAGDMHNVAFIADRQGKLAGIYRKVHLTVGESDQGLIPGTEFPVFELDFGRIGILICWDNWFPETARFLRMNGAEMLVFPIAGDGQYEHWEHVWPTRAMDNGIPLVTSLRGGGHAPSCIINRDGHILAASHENDVAAVADVDLAWQKEVFWLSVGPCMGNPYQLYEFERRREVYPTGEKNFRER